MAIAQRLSRYLPRLIALMVGLSLATVKWIFAWPGHRGPNPIAAMNLYYVESVYTSVVRSFSFHLDEVRAHIAALEAFSIGLLRRRIANGAYLFSQSVLAMPLGRFNTGLSIAAEMLYILKNDHLTPIAESDRSAATGGAIFIQAMAPTLRQDPACLDAIARLDAMNLRYFEVSATLCRILFRRFRGEEDAAVEAEARMDLLLVQAGSMWGPESQVIWMSALAYGLNRDVLGLRRSITELTRLIESGFRLGPQLELARGEYLRERGELVESRAALEKCLRLLPDDDAERRAAALCALAETHLAMNDPSAAILAAKAALAVSDHADVGDVTWSTRATRALAMAEAVQGDPESAVRRLDAAIAGATPLGSPSLLGSLHEGRAKVALSMGDVESYALHRNASDSWFRATGNPALIARVERLVDPGELRGAPASDGSEATVVASPLARGEALRTLMTGDVATLATDDDAARWVSAVLSGCRGPLERAARSLDILVEASAGSVGYIYLYQGGALHLLAPTYGEEPPDVLVAALTRVVEDATSPIAATMDVRWQPDIVPGDVTWVHARLSVQRDGRELAIGVVGIACDAMKARLPPPTLIEQVAKELYEAGDATLGSGATSTSALDSTSQSVPKRKVK
jgi:tetratricopeptide (TPR) repeat protein